MLQPSLGSWEGPRSSQLGACSPAWTLLLEGESEELSLHTFARAGARDGSEASGRCLDFPLLKLEGTRCGGRGGRVSPREHGREGGGKEGTKERRNGRDSWEPCQQCYKPRVLSNTICPEIKGSETETQQPVAAAAGPGGGVWNYCSDLEPDPGRWREGHREGRA